MPESIEPLITCDLHTHTILSGHAFSTVDELAAAASAGGLDLIAITDHGPNMEGAPHPGYFEMVGRLPKTIEGVKVLMGVEANIISLEGDLDLSRELLGRQDMVVAGLHEKTDFSGSTCAENTKAIAHAMSSGFVNIISHPYRPQFVVDVKELAKVAAATGVWLELNVSLLQRALAASTNAHGSEVVCQTRSMIDELVRHGGMCVVCSDAHHSSEVKSFVKSASQVINALCVPLEIIANSRVNGLSQKLMDC